jgi:two-component system response regulator DesR
LLVAEGAKARPGVRAATPPRRVRALVVDDHEVLRNGLRWVLTRVPWVERCVVAGSAAEAVTLAGALAFDVALVDVDLGAECGLRLCERLSATAPDMHVALLAARWDFVPARIARAAGARGVIAKDRPARELLAAVHELATGGALEPEPADGVRFAPREREILRLVGAGLTNAEIAASMYLAPGTIKHHMLGLYDKLGAPNRAAAVHAARRLGVLVDQRDEPGERVTAATSAAGSVRVLVADPDDVRRAGVLLALRGRSWVAAARGARDAEDALAVARRLRPDVAVTGSPEVTRALADTHPDLRLLLLGDGERDAGGAHGTLMQWWAGDRLAEAIRCGCDDPPEPGRAETDPLTRREREVLTAFATGATNAGIAAALGVSPNTVKQHASSIFRKLGARNRADAVRRADELGLL